MNPQFTERHHAFLSAAYYRLMRDEARPQWQAVFRMATQLYAQQRGSRMAQRALRDGQPLDFASYRAYGEWAPTEEGYAGLHAQNTADVRGDDLHYTVRGCPWCAQYLEMGLADGGRAYCDDLDVSIARGFNPDITYEVNQTQYPPFDTCLHVQRQAALGREVPPCADRLRDFTYHSAHLYYTYRGLLCAVWGEAGRELAETVLRQLGETYGAAYVQALEAFQNENFNLI